MNDPIETEEPRGLTKDMCKRFWWVFPVMAIVGPVIGLLLASVVMLNMKKLFESRAVIELKAPTTPVVSDVGTSRPENFNRVENEISTITSRANLDDTAEALIHSEFWSIGKDATARLIKEKLKCQAVQGTRMISISIRLPDKENARDVVLSVVESYKRNRERFSESDNKIINELDDQLCLEINKEFECHEALNTTRGSQGHLDHKYISDAEFYGVQLKAARKKIIELRAKMQSEQDRAKAATVSVFIHESPEIQDFPVSPNIKWNLFLGKLIGLLLSAILAFPAIFFLDRIDPLEHPSDDENVILPSTSKHPSPRIPKYYSESEEW